MYRKTNHLWYAIILFWMIFRYFYCVDCKQYGEKEGIYTNRFIRFFSMTTTETNVIIETNAAATISPIVSPSDRLSIISWVLFLSEVVIHVTVESPCVTLSLQTKTKTKNALYNIIYISEFLLLILNYKSIW